MATVPGAFEKINAIMNSSNYQDIVSWLPLTRGSDLAIEQAFNKIMKICSQTWKRGDHMYRGKYIEELCMEEWTKIYLQVSLIMLDLENEAQCCYSLQREIVTRWEFWRVPIILNLMFCRKISLLCYII